MLDNIIEVLNQIESNNYKAYIVGGFVRDYYLGLPSKDVDICTNAKIEDLEKILSNIISKNERYGSLVINYKGIKIEITTLRKDIDYENNRKPVNIEYVSTIKEDVKRRDFTINSLYMDKNKNIIDLVDGRKDIDNKVIKVVGDSNYKIKEDVLRILRAIRFATTLNFRLDNDLIEAIINNKELLEKLSYTRRKEELDKIFNSNNNKYGISLLLDLGLHKHLELDNLDTIVITDNSIGIWAQLDAGNYCFSTREQRIIANIRKLLNLDITDEYIIYQYGLELLKIVSVIKKIDYNLIVTKYNNLKIKSKKDIDITFNNIKDILNLEAEEVKKIYNDIELQIVYNKLNNEFADIKNYIINKYKGDATYEN
ncbi:MAG: hypothetical protein PHS45_00215 [Bacilli bacterium]|nr:hypothetical protein [Bacilli bacterium]